MRGRVHIISLMIACSIHMYAQSDLSHPRLFLRAGEEKALVANIAKDSLWTEMHRAIIAECDTIYPLAPMERVIVGPRLHATSCEVLRRVLFLSYAYRTTGVEKYAERAEKEMLHICEYVDWNPSHFLDVSEMGTALAIGYDWLYDYLQPASRDKILRAIIDKAIVPGETGGAGDPAYNLRWLNLANNWNQVCNGGLTVAAIATYTENKEQSERIIRRSCEKILIPMKEEYAPMGCFPEGFGYWAFGTQYNILFVDAMQKFFGPECVQQYKEMPGFIESGNYSQQLITPSLRTFGYSDNSTRIYLEPAVMWFNTVKSDPRMYYMQKRLFEKFEPSRSYIKTIKNRLIPFMLIWGVGTGEKPIVSLDSPQLPTENYYLGKGNNDICVMRTGWDADDAYLGFKAGRVRNPHGHMDIGSFYYEYGGVCWSLDLGSDVYENIELAGVSLFNMAQNSPRWTTLTKYNNFAHSTTYPLGEYQDIDVTCRILGDEKGMWASATLSPLYKDKIKFLVRRVSLKDKSAIIEDVVTAGDEEVEMVWNMTTEAVSMKRNGNNLILSAKDGQMLEMKVEASAPFSAELVPALRKNSFEDENVGISWLRITYNVPSNENYTIKVNLIP